MKNRLSPSILAADFSALQEDVALAEAAGAKSFHFDIMDGHFVPNISYGAGIVSALRNKSKAFFDVHLMVEEPDCFFPDYKKAGADRISCLLYTSAFIWLCFRERRKIDPHIVPEEFGEVILRNFRKGWRSNSCKRRKA